MAATPRISAIPALAPAARSANAHAHAPAHSACRAYAYTAMPTYAYARTQKPYRMAAIPAIANKGIQVPAHAGCTSRLLAPKVARVSAQPRVCAPHRAASSRRSCSASQPGRRERRRPHRAPPRRPVRLAPRCGCLLRSHPPQLRQPASGLPPHRSKPATVAHAPSAVFPRAPQAPLRGLAPQGREGREERGPSAPRAHAGRFHMSMHERTEGERGAPQPPPGCRTPLAPSRLI